jgi:translation initiation factor SUI1
MFEDIELQLNTQKVVIQVQKRNGRQCFTIISDIAKDFDYKKICRYLKKTLNCGGNVLKDEKLGEIIRLTGDQKQEIYKADKIIIKGI